MARHLGLGHWLANGESVTYAKPRRAVGRKIMRLWRDFMELLRFIGFLWLEIVLFWVIGLTALLVLFWAVNASGV